MGTRKVSRTRVLLCIIMVFFRTGWAFQKHLLPQANISEGVTYISSEVKSAATPESDITIEEYFTTVRYDIRVHNALLRGGINTMAELCEMSDEQLMRVRNFGAYCLAVVVEERQKYLAARKQQSSRNGA